MDERPSLYEIERDALAEWLTSQGEAPYRAGQILDWIYVKRARDFAAMSNLSQSLRERLSEHFRLGVLEPVQRRDAGDSTRKSLFRLADGRLIETVLIPASPALYGEASDRLTVCVSSQVGCAYGCRFCASGLAGFARNLTAAEIVEQVIQIEAQAGDRVNNLVFMGMGEPLANLENLTRAIHVLNADWGVRLGARRMTVSTSGLAPQIETLAQEPLQIRLAISLHGATDEVRERIMPINRKYPLERLFEALRVWQSHKKQRITFEYILIKDVNDGLDQAAELARRARSVSAKVNLIPYNTVEELDWERPSAQVQEAFLEVLKERGVPATLRREKGGDIAAACGQLRLREEVREGVIEPAALTGGGS